ncbi:aryl-sulfate sulfotransferase, partial [Candidatus Daviesbacteria bacterium]|nr:aryl-sulfate sulfotransferase [Candidatus Daviesbacteria bacterium]
SIAYFLIYFFFFIRVDNNFSSFGTIPIINKDKIQPGYTLIAPYNRQMNPVDWTGRIYLLDLLGNPVHIWKTKHQPLYAILQKNGNLLVAIEDPVFDPKLPPGGNTGIIQELSWDSKVLWEYKNRMLHHDIVPLENGNVLVALWEKTPDAIAASVQGGVLGTELNGAIFSDEIAEINRQGEKVWSWHSYEHQDPALDTIGDLIPRYGWTYTNGMKYLDKDPIEGKEALLLSMRSQSTVFIVRIEDGQIIWRSPKGMVNVQHDPTLLDNGNILVFDNGLTRIPNPHPLFGSRVLEINPKTNQIDWQFNGGKSVIEKVRFLAPITSGAQRLKNGNTLITDGPKGHIFEVTKDGELVWDLINPYFAKSNSPWPVNFLFKVRRYSEDEINWPEKIAPPINDFTFNLYLTLSQIYPR